MRKPISLSMYDLFSIDKICDTNNITILDMLYQEKKSKHANISLRTGKFFSVEMISCSECYSNLIVFNNHSQKFRIVRSGGSSEYDHEVLFNEAELKKMLSAMRIRISNHKRNKRQS